MREAFIVDGLRTPIGKRGGSLKGIHAVDLLGLVIENCSQLFLIFKGEKI